VKKRILIAVVAGIAVFGAALAFAASLTLSSDNVAAGDATVLTCDTAVNATYNLTFSGGVYKVQNVTVNGIAAGCSGQKVGVTLTDAGGVVVGDGQAVADASGAVLIAITEAPAAANVTGVHAVVISSSSTSPES
jgi:hypothetical protein